MNNKINQEIADEMAEKIQFRQVFQEMHEQTYGLKKALDRMERFVSRLS
ncbi:hypothetical protein [Brevibacillus panacihumi]